ncbi:amino acid ABC transporter permease [Azospirillum thiophilum]|uniref:Amino acid ABC transporter permease n=2 Tax=Azospirillum thiophilum TaxID=528244 RepID=A0AAC8ZVT7_9PROT|nr:amino acid ABC transporter permease [Azospirillum thiophilum]KJR63938.1 amino acid ABC transporter permease [Azospirillum thiophilum]
MTALKPFGWAKDNLFNTPLNTALTVACLVLLWLVVPPAASWLLLNASWTGASSEACREAAGACWTVIAVKHRLIFFGTYPYDEQWRPFLACALFVAMLGASGVRAFWRPWLAGAWALTLVGMGVLMWGGVLGLSYVANDRWGGLPITLMLSVFSIALAFPLSILLALGRQSSLPAIRTVCVGFIETMRGVPLVSVLFMASVMFPLFLPEGVTVDKLLRALAGMTLFTAAYLAEAVRGGLQAIPRGQYEAADALGLSYWQKTALIVLPQALRIVIPPIVNQFISAFKDTSLVTIVGLYDLLTAATVATTDPEWRPYFAEVYIFAGLMFWIFCFSMSRYSQWLERLANRYTSR